MTAAHHPMPATHRWYIRCADCLSVSMVELPTTSASTASRTIAGWRCICDGRLEAMGYVRIYRTAEQLVTRDAEVCACDERCTTARGPSCNCKCGGANHGLGLGATVRQITTDSVPIVTPPGDAEKAAGKAREYREAHAAALARIEASPEYPVYMAKLAGKWTDRFTDYLQVRDWLADLRSVAKARTHKGRLAKCAAICAGGAS